MLLPPMHICTYRRQLHKLISDNILSLRASKIHRIATAWRALKKHVMPQLPISAALAFLNTAAESDIRLRKIHGHHFGSTGHRPRLELLARHRVLSADHGLSEQKTTRRLTGGPFSEMARIFYFIVVHVLFIYLFIYSKKGFPYQPEKNTLKHAQQSLQGVCWLPLSTNRAKLRRSPESINLVSTKGTFPHGLLSFWRLGALDKLRDPKRTWTVKARSAETTECFSKEHQSNWGRVQQTYVCVYRTRTHWGGRFTSLFAGTLGVQRPRPPPFTNQRQAPNGLLICHKAPHEGNL